MVIGGVSLDTELFKSVEVYLGDVLEMTGHSFEKRLCTITIEVFCDKAHLVRTVILRRWSCNDRLLSENWRNDCTDIVQVS